jgi:hypothetical protein
VSLPPAGTATSPPIRFRIPPGEGNRQRGIEADSDSGAPGSFTVAPPKGMSYLLRLDVSVELAPDSGPGTISIVGKANDANATEVLVRVERDDSGRLRARWYTYDLLAGQRSGPVGEGPTRVRTENYTPFNSVVPGLNSLRFGIEASGEARLSSATVLADSGLSTTLLKPARLELSTEPQDGGRMDVGEAIGIDFTIANVGDRVARDVRVGLQPLSKKASLLGRKEFLYDELTGSESGTFFVMPKREGEVKFKLVAQSSNANNPGGLLEAEIGSGDGPLASAPPWLLAALISGLAILGWRQWRRRRARAG